MWKLSNKCAVFSRRSRRGGRRRGCQTIRRRTPVSRNKLYALSKILCQNPRIEEIGCDCPARSGCGSWPAGWAAERARPVFGGRQDHADRATRRRRRRRIEAVSFVNPKRVPQMADAEERHGGSAATRGCQIHRARHECARLRTRGRDEGRRDQFRRCRLGYVQPAQPGCRRRTTRSGRWPTWRRRRAAPACR